MDTLTVHINKDLKRDVQEKIKNDGASLTFIVVQALKAYSNGKLKFGLLDSEDSEITASFDISDNEGKKECIDNFKSLIA